MKFSKIVLIVLTIAFVLGCFHSNKSDIETSKDNINEKNILMTELIDGKKNIFVVKTHCYNEEVQTYYTTNKPDLISRTTIFQFQDSITKENILTSCPIKVKQITNEAEIIDLIENLTINNNITSI